MNHQLHITASRRFLSAFCIFTVLFVFTTAEAQTDVPRIISYQGQITTDGLAMIGIHHITATLYSDRFGKDTLWQGQYDAAVTNGIFSVTLGSGKYKLPESAAMDKPLWIGIKIDEVQEMKPLTQLASAPYAINVADKSITFNKLSAELQTSMLNSGTGNSPKTQSANGGGINTANTCNTNEDGRNGANEVAGGCGNIIWSGIIDGITYRPINYSVISGGQGNLITNRLNNNNPYTEGTNWHVIAGGYANTIAIDVNGGSDSELSILGGSTISGGVRNTLSAPFGFIGGGNQNIISFINPPIDCDGGNVMQSDVIAGGNNNSIDTAANHSIIGGGYYNHISGAGSEAFHGAGYRTVTDSANRSFIGGGGYNTIRSSIAAVIGGGNYNTVLSGKSAIVGGDTNLIKTSSDHSFIGGGWNNTISSTNSVIAGGNSNTVTGIGSAIPGGSFLKLNGHSFGFSGQTGTTLTDLSAQTQIGVFNDVDLWIGNQDSSARKIKFFGPTNSATYSGVKFTSFRAGLQSANIEYVLPLVAGTNGQVLTTDGSSNLYWSTVSGGGGRTYVWYDEDAFHSPAAGQGPVANGYAAIAHGENVTTHSAYGAVGGGEHNLIDSFARHSVIAGGGYNTIPRRLNHRVIVGSDSVQMRDSMEYSFIGGGHANILRAPYGVIAGGESNLIDSNLYWGASYSAIGGGFKNTIDVESPYNVIAGGGYNYHDGYLSFIGGGSRDTVFSNCGWDVIAGGYANYIGNQSHSYANPKSIKYAVIAGGDTNTVAASFSGILSGKMNIIADNAEYSSISGGDSNIIAANSTHSFLGGGFRNTIDTGSRYAVLSGGFENLIGHSSNYSFIGGGYKDTILGMFGVIAGGDSNAIRSNIGHGTSDGCTIGGGKDNFVNALDSGFLGGHYPPDYVVPQYATVAGGKDNCVYGHYATVSGGWHNFAAGAFSTILGGQFLQADDYQTVIGRCNLNTKGLDPDYLNNWKSANRVPFNSSPGSTRGQIFPTGDYWTFIVGNGSLDSTRLPSTIINRSNAFMVSDNGHTMVTDTGGSGGASPSGGVRTMMKGGTYMDNVIDAWAVVEWRQSEANIHAPDSLFVQADHGCASVNAMGQGVYQVQLNLTDPITGGSYIMRNASVTATLMDFGHELGECCIINVTPISNNIFTIKIKYVTGCAAINHSFTFHVTGR